MRPRLSFANVTALLALCLALTSPAWSSPVAQSAASLSQKVKKALRTAKKANKTAKKASKKADRALASPGPRGPRGAQGARGPQGRDGARGASATSLFASVRANGNLNSGRGVIESSGTGGLYHVQFNRPLTGCTALTTVGTGEPSGAGDAYAEGSRATAAVGVGAFVGDTRDEVRVITTNNAGATTGQSFHIAVFCP